MSKQKVVLVNGCFDILHPGHIHFLQEAADQGDVLIVGLNVDETVTKAKKVCHRPFADRMAMLYALRYVDCVLGFREQNACALVDMVRPDVYVTGEEYRGRSAEVRLVKEYGGLVHYVPRVEGYSTTTEAVKNTGVKVKV